jgi:hypothetical protein
MAYRRERLSSDCPNGPRSDKRLLERRPSIQSAWRCRRTSKDGAPARQPRSTRIGCLCGRCWFTHHPPDAEARRRWLVEQYILRRSLERYEALCGLDSDRKALVCLQSA